MATRKRSPSTDSGLTRSFARAVEYDAPPSPRVEPHDEDPSAPQPARRGRPVLVDPGALVGCALDLFVEKGYAATRLDDVARAAGVSKGTLYLYFDSKLSLFAAVVTQGLVPALAEGEALVDGFSGRGDDLMRELLWGWWRLIGATRLGGLPKLMVAEARNFPDIAELYHRAVMERGCRLVGRAIDYGHARGDFRISGDPCTVQAVMAPLLLRVLMKHSFGCVDPGAATGSDGEDIAASIEFVIKALKHD
jgi:AcrR family transcriptional regulator